MSQARQKPRSSALRGMQLYLASAPGFMSHAHVQVEGVVWCHYDESFREKMAATGVKE